MYVVVVCPLQPSSSVNSGCPGPESSILVSSRWACPQPTRVQDLSAVNVTSKSQADRVNRNAYRYSVVTLVLFICK